MGDGPQPSLANGTVAEAAKDGYRVHHLHEGRATAHATDDRVVVIDLRDGMSERRSASSVAEWARRVSTDLPERLRAEMAPHLPNLSPDAVRLLEVASFLNPSFSVGDAAEVMGVPVGALLPVLEEVLDASVLVPCGDALAFRHEAVCKAVYADVPKPVRLALHRQIGALFLTQGRPAGCAAAHLIVGAEEGDVWAVAGLERAARETLRSSPPSAAAMALRALELTGESDQDRLSRAATAVEAVLAARRVREATELARTALATSVPLPAPTARLRLTLALVAFMEGRTGEAVDEAERVLTQTGVAQECYTAAEVLRLYALVVQQDFEGARQAAEEILGGPEREGGDGALAAALAGLSCVEWEEGRAASALCLVRAAVARGDRGPVEARCIHPSLGLATMLTALGDFSGAEAAIDASCRDIDLFADTLWVAAPPAFRSRVHLAAGRLGEAVSEAETALALAEELGTRVFAPMALGVLVSAGLSRGDLTSAARHLERSRGEPASGRTLAGAGSAVWAEARLAEVEGDQVRAAAVLEGVYDDPVHYRRLFLEEPASAAWLVRFALAAGKRTSARAVVASVEQVAADNAHFPTVGAAAAHARGVLDADPDLLELAAAAHGQPWAAASASEDAGCVLAEEGDRTGAGVRLERALAAYERAGADRDATRVRARLRDVGIRRRHWKRTQRSAWGWGSLTETEQKVTALVARGLTNLQVSERMFLSRHTIDFHLRQIFRKLGIASRVELTRLAMEHEGAQATVAD